MMICTLYAENLLFENLRAGGLFSDVPAVSDQFIADGFHAQIQAAAALCGLVSGTDFVVVKLVFLPD